MHIHGQIQANSGHPVHSLQGAGVRSAQQCNSEGVDAVTAQQIAALHEKKQIAVNEENYDLAKALKQEIAALKALGARILELETRFDHLVNRSHTFSLMVASVRQPKFHNRIPHVFALGCVA